jgi:hypothetical protein
MTNEPNQSKKINKFKLVDVDLKKGMTFTTLVNDKELIQQHFDLNAIEKFFGGKK